MAARLNRIGLAALALCLVASVAAPALAAPSEPVDLDVVVGAEVRQQRDLHLGGARVAATALVVLHNLVLLFGG